MPKPRRVPGGNKVYVADPQEFERITKYLNNDYDAPLSDFKGAWDRHNWLRKVKKFDLNIHKELCYIANKRSIADVIEARMRYKLFLNKFTINKFL